MMAKSFRKRNTILICLGLIIAVLMAFEPIRHNDFVDYDDDVYITENPHIKGGLTWVSVKWAFTTPYAANWHPLTWLSHIIDYQLFGLKPLGHHLVNLLFHIINTLLLFLVLKSMTKAIWPSAFVAAVFALHPLHVESVVWVAERKDVLSTFFWLLTMAAYVRYCRIPSVGKYIFVVLFFALGLMAKPMLVTLPLVLLLLDWWPLGRFQWAHRKDSKDLPLPQSFPEGFGQVSSARLLMEKIPLFILVVASCVVTFLAQQHGGAVASVENISVEYRVGNALMSYVGYINKMVYPRNLAVLYPLAAKLISMPQLIFSLLELTAISGVVFYFSRRRGYLAMGWLWYLGTLVPVIGLVQVGYAAMANRYTYIPLIGIFIMVTWGSAEILSKWRFRKSVVVIAVSIIIAAMAIGTRKEVEHWQNSVSLFRHTLEVTQNNFIASSNLGVAYIDLGRYQDAIDACENSIRIKPDYSDAHYNLGIACGKFGRYQEAIDAFKQANLINPNYAETHYNLGIACGKLGRFHKAIDAFKQAILINPDDAKAHYNLGMTFGKLGRFQEAKDALKQAILINPDDGVAHYNLGIAFGKLGRYQDEIDAFSQAIRINGAYAEVHSNLGVAYGKIGQYPKAVDFCKKAVELNPNLANAHYNLGFVYSKVGQYHKAIEFCSKAVDINPDYAEAHLMLGVSNFKLGRYSAAIDSYQKAILVKPDFAKAHYNLGIVYGYQGRHLKAIAAFEDAIRFNSDYVNAYQNLGVAYRQLGRYQDEVDAYKQVVRIKPKDAKAHYNLGVAYHTIGDKLSANKEYEILKRFDRKRANQLLGLINAKR